MKTLRLVLGDQLSRSLSALEDLDADTDVVLMAEVDDETTYVRHHPQKIALIFSAMRHFAEALRGEGVKVDYTCLDDDDAAESFTAALEAAVARHEVDRIVMTEPGEWRVLEMMNGWCSAFDLPVEIRDDTRFLATLDRFRDWADGRKRLTMEYFYRELRRETGWLMDGDDPVGGEWNYDADNRKALPDDCRPPQRERFEPDATTNDVLALVEERFGDHFGSLDGFSWAVTRDQALTALDHFIEDCLPRFGDYQDAMAVDEDFLFHAVLSPYLNIGLLLPREVCEAAIAAWEDERAPLNAVEGFVRQILGWREFVRGLYWLKMPEYRDGNFLEARRDLPELYWGAKTDMRCLHQAVDATRRNAYAHHIQRLMITGNFALLAGIDPRQVQDWYLEVYADAFEWVELPNTHGMALFADGGVMATKPYAASANYINKMSDYCGECRYRHTKRTGEDACPFNYLYWDFLDRNRERLDSNHRMGFAYRNLDRLDPEELDTIREQSRSFLDEL